MLASKKDHPNGCTSIQNSETIKPAKSHQLLMCPDGQRNDGGSGQPTSCPKGRMLRPRGQFRVCEPHALGGVLIIFPCLSYDHLTVST